MCTYVCIICVLQPMNGEDDKRIDEWVCTFIATT